MKKRKVPLGKAIRWSEMKSKSGDDFLLELATPDAELIELAKAQAVPALRPFLEAEQVEDAPTEANQ